MFFSRRLLSLRLRGRSNGLNVPIIFSSRSLSIESSGSGALQEKSDDELCSLVLDGKLKEPLLEKELNDATRAVRVRRKVFEKKSQKSFSSIPLEGYDYEKVYGVNCEMVVGFVPIPLGVVGPLNVNGQSVFVPMATTEGALLASTNRGCKAITECGGARAAVLKDGISRAPCLRLSSSIRCAEMVSWINEPANFKSICDAFNSTTSVGRLLSIHPLVAGRNIYLRFVCSTGDAMGMNMISKGTLKAIDVLRLAFDDLILVALSGNVCTDKKPSAINWIEGRGKSVIAETVLTRDVVEKVLKTTVEGMICTNKEKCLIGSALAGSVGGFNAHASNIVTAVFLATGQDPAQNVESSNCITCMESHESGGLFVSVSMPSLEVGTIGGGTHLAAQANCLDILGIKGSSGIIGENAKKFATYVAGTVLAGEVSLIAALTSNDLVKAHMQHNRKSVKKPAEV